MVALTPLVPGINNNSSVQDVVVSQQQSIVALQNQIQNIQTEVTGINSGLQGIGTLIRNDSLLEQTRLLEEQKREKLLAERNVRLGKEKEVEERINASLTESIKTLEPRLNSVFDRISSSLSALFGFLGTNVIQSISFISRFVIKGLTNVKGFVSKTLGFVAGTISGLKNGFGNIIGSVGNVIKKITGIALNLAKSPIKFIADLFKKIPGLVGGGASAAVRASSSAVSAGGSILDDIFKLGGKAVSSGVGGLFAAGVDIATGEKPERAIAGGVGAGVGGALLGAATGSVFGPAGTIIGGITGSIAGQQGAKSLYDYSTTNFNPQAFNSNISNNFNFNPGQFLSGITEGTKGLLKGTGINEILNAESKTNQKIEDSAKTQITISPRPSKPPNEELPPPSLTANIAEISPPPKQNVPVTPLPEPKPDVVVASTVSQEQTKAQQSVQFGSLTDVPLLPSANVDNFYSLYSQTHYNVVM